MKDESEKKRGQGFKGSIRLREAYGGQGVRGQILRLPEKMNIEYRTLNEGH